MSKSESRNSVPTVSHKLKKAVKRERSDIDKILAQLKHWSKGKKTVVTIPNPNKNETNKRFIKVEGNHPAAFGPWKRAEKDTGIKISND